MTPTLISFDHTSVKVHSRFASAPEHLVLNVASHFPYKRDGDLGGTLPLEILARTTRLGARSLRRGLTRQQSAV